ncbi:MAG: penicillin-binding protein 2 [Patescibacteria group bacterium]|nr:penicillin-binding protein 2 [Patescibacteria group bacterium]
MYNFFRKKSFSSPDPSDPFVIKYDVSGGALPHRLDKFTIDHDIGAEASMSSSEENKYIGVTISSKKIKFFAIAIIAVVFVLVVRSAYLQVGLGDYYSELAEGNRIRIKQIPSLRGVIYDRSGKMLVKNDSSFALAVTPLDLPRDKTAREQAIAGIVAEFGLNADEVSKTLEEFPWNYSQPVIVKTDLVYEEALVVYLKTGDFPGISVTTDTRRDYLAAQDVESFSHLIGYMGRINDKEYESLQAEDYLRGDKIGKSGLEATHERELRGYYGKKKIEVDAFGIETKIISQEDRVDGNNLYLSIDYSLQKEVETILNSQLAAYGKSKGAVIIMDPRNGEILSLVSTPGYDNNLFAGGISTEDYQNLISDPDNPLFNRAVSGEYPSGSTFKLVVAAAGLEEGIISPATTVMSTGGLLIGKWFFPDWKAGGHGLTDVYKALADSVNTFFYYIGGGFEDFEGLGVKRLTEYAQKFGIGNPTGIDLPGEASGLLPSPEWKKKTKKEQWYIGDTYHYAIGQGDLLVTPLQVAVYTSIFANGGTLYQPHIVHQIEDVLTHRLTTVPPVTINNQVANPENIQVVRAGMRYGVTEGSSRRLSTLPVSIAGKTGTAQWSTTRDPHAWFTGFAPYNNPEIVVTVLVEEGGEGSEVAVPIAYDIFLWYFNNYKKSQIEVINLD